MVCTEPCEDSAAPTAREVETSVRVSFAHRADLHSPAHALMVKRGLRDFYRRMALLRLGLTPVWAAALLAAVTPTAATTSGPPGDHGTRVWFILATAGIFALGALAAWAHHHRRALDWMAARPVLRCAAEYLERTARTRRVAVDVPGLTEGIGAVAMTVLTAQAAPRAGADPLAWSIALSALLLCYPFTQYVIDPSWYQERYAHRPGLARCRWALPALLAVTGFVVYRAAVPDGSAGPDTAVLVAALLLRLYTDISLVDCLMGGLGETLRDQRKDLADTVSSVVHSKIKNEMRILRPVMAPDEQSAAARASWHSLVHNVEQLRCHPFREDGPADLAELLADVRGTALAYALDRSMLTVSTHLDVGEGALRSTDLALLGTVLSDLCANSVQAANRLNRRDLHIAIRVVTAPQRERHRITASVEDNGPGFGEYDPLSDPRSSLTVLDRRLRQRGGGLTVGRAARGGSRVSASWLCL